MPGVLGLIGDWQNDKELQEKDGMKWKSAKLVQLGFQTEGTMPAHILLTKL